jgi:hypothetical protein
VTTPTPISFDQVKVGMTVRQTWPDGTTTSEGVVEKIHAPGTREVATEFVMLGKFIAVARDAANLHLIAPAPTPPMEEPQTLGSHVLCDDGEWVAVYTERHTNRIRWCGIDRETWRYWSEIRNPRPVPAALTMTLDEAIGLIDTTVLVNERGVVTKEYLRERFRAAFAAKGEVAK